MFGSGVLLLGIFLVSVEANSCSGACGKAIQINGVIDCYCHDLCVVGIPGNCCADMEKECPVEYKKGVQQKESENAVEDKLPDFQLPEGCEAPSSRVVPIPDKQISFEEAGGSCANNCVSILVDAKDEPVCYCDSSCLLTGDCCSDFVDVCEVDRCILALVMPSSMPPPKLTCKDNCNKISVLNTPTGATACSCEPVCVENANCCDDYKEFCPLDPQFTVVEKILKGDSCYSKCGGRSNTCWCDYGCLENGDCCDDYLDMCGVKFSTVKTIGLSSCHNRCGGAALDCWCDDKCMYSGDCCIDYLKRCNEPVYG